MIPVITIDGPSGTGKGSLMQLLAQRLGWHALDSGALYRALAWAALRRGVDLADAPALAELTRDLLLAFRDGRVWLDGEDISDAIRTEEVGMAASRVAAHPQVRAALLDWQRAWARPPGLVADGRDMGTVVFPEAQLKIFLDADPKVRAERRYRQLKEKGLSASLRQLILDIQARDARDRTRSSAPLCPAQDAIVIDSSQMSIPEVFERVLAEVRRVLPDTLGQ
ncbi:(d)CMP kinase [Caldichromatium japonicum]|uniref:Cytidylate kinase n=1 Tax=Caldichromatium japonicum TaxID=2699430 RepID=A0A6G7VBQ4_9GAMM|nr:(d)CMP kinase [Caldichromatium japonicum]QIK37382.1 (d)CMP kinase [Caldichromatium japonicum]